MSGLDFLSPDQASAVGGFAPELTSPMARAFAEGAPAGIEDISLSTGKIEIWGDVNDLRIDGVSIARYGERALVVCDYDHCATLRAELAPDFETVVDATGALAGLRIDRPDAETLLRRVTDLDLDALPAAGTVSHIRAIVFRDGEASFRLFFPQEYGHYLAEVVFDAAEGIA